MRDRLPNQSKPALASFVGSAIDRAIYVDYEGVPWRPPVFVGWLVDGRYRGAIVDEAYSDCVHRYRAKEVDVIECNAKIASSLLERAIAEERHIVAWSQHDKRILWNSLGASERAELQSTFVNAIKLGRPWHAKHFGPGLRKGHARLCYFAQALGQQVPEKYGDKVVGKSLATVGKALCRFGSYGAIEKQHREAWVVAVKHNKWDVALTRNICMLIDAGAAPAAGFEPPPEAMAT